MANSYPPVLTIADLTPPLFDTDSETSLNSIRSRKTPTFYSTISDVEKGSASKTREVHSIIQNTKNQFTHEKDKEQNILRKQLSSKNEENLLLLLQNKKLMNELENASFCIQQCRLEIKEQQSLKDQVFIQGEELNIKNYAIKELEKLITELRQHTCEIEDQNENLKEEHDLVNQNLKSLKRHCENLEMKVDQLNKKNNDLLITHESDIAMINKLTSYNKEVDEKCVAISTENKDFCKKLKEADSLHLRLRDEINNLNSKSIEVTALTDEILNFKFEIKKKDEKISEYEDDIRKLKLLVCEKTKNLKDGNDLLPQQLTNEDVKDFNKIQAINADLQLKLDMKDAEIQRLQTATMSSSYEKIDSFNLKGENSLYVLRAELTPFIDKVRYNEKVRCELDHKIAQQHEDIAKQAAQVIELTGRLGEKDMLIDSLENKLNERNNNLFQLQREKEKLLHQQISNKETIQSLSSCLKSHQEDYRTTVSELEKKNYELDILVKSYSEKITHLESLLLAHDEETKATDSLVTKIKLLHEKHCKELEQQILGLQNKLQQEILKVESLEKKIKLYLKDGKSKSKDIQHLQEYVAKMEQLLNEKNNLVEQYKEKLQKQSDSEKDRALYCETIITKYKSDIEQKCKEYESKELEYKSKLLVVENELKVSKDAIRHFNGEVATKNKHIEELKKSCEENFKMLKESNKRIAELEDAHEEEYTSLRESSLHDQIQLKDELAKLKTEKLVCQKELQLYRNQIQELTSTLGDAKLQFVTLGNDLDKKDSKVSELEAALVKKEKEIEESNSINKIQIKELSLNKKKIKELEKDISCKDKTINVLHEEKNDLFKKLEKLEEKCNRISSTCFTAEENFKEAKKEILLKHEALSRCERMLAISQDGLTIKEKELNDYHMRVTELQEVLDQQQWSLKEKAAMFTQLDMNIKQQQSEWQSKVEHLKLYNAQIEKELEDKNNKLNELSIVGSNLKRELDSSSKRCQEMERMLKIQEEANLNSSAELKIIKEELEKCQVEFKKKMESEIQLALVKQNNEINQLQQKLHKTSCECLIAQKAATEISQEVENLRNTLSLKEKDCSRLARELGACQMREAQERAKFNQELNQASKYHQLEINHQNEQLDSLRGDLDLYSTSHQHQVLNLQLQLQRKSEEHHLCERDLEHYKIRTSELEDCLKAGENQLKVEKGRSRELNECLVLKDAEIARLSARVSGFERNLLMQQNNFDQEPRPLGSDDSMSSEKSQDIFLPLSAVDSTMFKNQKESITQRMRIISPVRELTFDGLDETSGSYSNDIFSDANLTSVGALSISSFST
ncbi:coiled-coil domain-containing protein 18 isoform X1 [Hydra vulgaris]|uniref:coiled-coil domain-containing protein 18 isoform X1 n=2 Tax=Hydra vulgaris TaxID=6087 RepID=UPI001F5F4E6B|nr:coiled-coil domain-containing protein 18 isoform X1 [Hydra vulgaris]